MPVGTSAYVPLANLTLGSAATTVTFSSISQYRDLVLVSNPISSSGSVQMLAQINDLATSNYNFVYMQGNGSTATSGSFASQFFFYLAYGNALVTTSAETTVTANFFDINVSDKHPSCLIRTSNASNGVYASAQRYNSLGGITKMALTLNGANFAAGSTFALYGIAS
jgi:hypothetical protein